MAGAARARARAGALALRRHARLPGAAQTLHVGLQHGCLREHAALLSVKASARVRIAPMQVIERTRARARGGAAAPWQHGARPRNPFVLSVSFCLCSPLPTLALCLNWPSVGAALAGAPAPRALRLDVMLSTGHQALSAAAFLMEAAADEARHLQRFFRFATAAAAPSAAAPAPAFPTRPGWAEAGGRHGVGGGAAAGTTEGGAPSLLAALVEAASVPVARERAAARAAGRVGEGNVATALPGARPGPTQEDDEEEEDDSVGEATFSSLLAGLGAAGEGVAAGGGGGGGGVADSHGGGRGRSEEGAAEVEQGKAGGATASVLVLPEQSLLINQWQFKHEVRAGMTATVACHRNALFRLVRRVARAAGRWRTCCASSTRWRRSACAARRLCRRGRGRRSKRRRRCRFGLGIVRAARPSGGARVDSA